MKRSIIVVWVAMLIFSLAMAEPVAARGAVVVRRAPDRGLQPRVAVGPDGTLHMIYFKGRANGGDIYYVRRAPGEREFSSPVRVNSQPNSAMIVGTMRGPQLALGEDQRVNVVWFGSSSAKPRSPGGTPILYTQLKKNGKEFVPQRNLVQWADPADGQSIAADDDGDVYVFWHAAPRGKSEAEAGLYMTMSRDGGEHFDRERQVSPGPLGACGCCGTAAMADDAGHVHAIFRAATAGVHRDTYLLSSQDRGQTFQANLLGKWRLNACPMSSADIAEHGSSVVLAWEIKGQIRWTSLPAGSTSTDEIMGATDKVSEERAKLVSEGSSLTSSRTRLSVAPNVGNRNLQINNVHHVPGQANKRKHPAVAVSADGRILIVWTQGTGWNHGGSLAWQVYDAAGRPTSERGRHGGLPAWDRPDAYASPDGGFVILY